MDEHVDFLETGDQRGEPLAARASDVGPSVSACCRDRRCRFLVKLRAERVRKVQAPEMPGAIEGHSLEDDPARHTPRHASFDTFRAEVSDGTPGDSPERRVGIAVLPVSPTTQGEPAAARWFSMSVQTLLEVLEFVTGPG